MRSSSSLIQVGLVFPSTQAHVIMTARGVKDQGQYVRGCEESEERKDDLVGLVVLGRKPSCMNRICVESLVTRQTLYPNPAQAIAYTSSVIMSA